MTDEFGADVRRWSLADVASGEVVRSAQFDITVPPFDDPRVWERVLDRVLDAASPYAVPRVMLTADSGRPVVLPEPQRKVSMVIPDVPLTQEQVDAANRAFDRHPFVNVHLVRVPK